MKKHRSGMTTGYTIGIYALILAGFMLLVLFGANIYSQVVDSREDNNNQRSLLSYISIAVRNHDHEGAVSVGQGPEGDMLLLTDQVGETAYVTRIYLDSGELVEEYGRAETEVGQGQTQSIGTCGEFHVEVLSDQCFRVRTDQGSVLLRLRSVSGGSE